MCVEKKINPYGIASFKKVPGLAGGFSSTWSSCENKFPDFPLLLFLSHHVFKVVQLHDEKRSQLGLIGFVMTELKSQFNFDVGVLQKV